MQLRRDSLLVLGLATAVCLLGGLVFGIATGRWAQAGAAAPSPTHPAPGPTTTGQPLVIGPGQQASLLVVGVTDTGATVPILEGCWVFTFRPGIPEYYVLSFPADANFHLAGMNNNLSLSQIYSVDLHEQPAYGLMRSAIEARFPALKVHAALTIDRRAVSDLISKTGPIDIQGTALSGAELLQAYDQKTTGGMPEQMLFQQAALEALFKGLAASHWSPGSLSAYLEQLPGGAADAATLDSLAAAAPSLQDARIIWSVYTPELETSSTP